MGVATWEIFGRVSDFLYSFGSRFFFRRRGISQKWQRWKSNSAERQFVEREALRQHGDSTRGAESSGAAKKMAARAAIFPRPYLLAAARILTPQGLSAQARKFPKNAPINWHL